ncbi:hypothetical protein LTR53_004290 [Teratosphaeriaceae sp. CCFEE 6253]|nr:hypothetical protein LTR53_004290 [Teratosphaeriaceae sp. CCFEE 6253]
MATARWASRLPRASEHLIIRRTARSAIWRAGQRRWIQKPPPRIRPWAGRAGAAKHVGNAASQPIPQPQDEPRPDPPPDAPGRNAQLATALADSDTSDLVSEVHIPNDPRGVLPSSHPALSLLGNSSLVIQRQLEMMNVMLGFEQANRYIIMDGQGQTIGYIAERDHGIGSAVARQMFRTHRSFTTHIFDKEEREVLRIHRPFAYINSRIRIYDPVPEGGYGEMEGSADLQGVAASSATGQGPGAQVSPLPLDEMRIIGEAQQQWAPLRRKYNLFSYRPLEPNPVDSQSTPRLESGEHATSDTTALTEAKVPDQAIEAGMQQFAHVNEPFLSWDFNLRNESGSAVGSVNRNFGGFAREIFTDTGVYALRMDAAAQSSVLESAEGKEVAQYERDATAMTLDQRAVMLATAVSIDFDYFSRHSGAGTGGFLPYWMIPWGGTAAEGGAAGAGAGAAGGAAEAGTAVGAAEGAGAVGAAGRGIAGAGAGESGIAAAGTMAGYEAMQRGAYGSQPAAGEGNPANEPLFDPDNQSPQQGQAPEQQESPWGDDQDPWGGGGPGDGPPPPAAGGGDGGGGGGEGGGEGWSLDDFF